MWGTTLYSMLNVTEGCSVVDLTQLAQYKAHWIAPVNKVMNFKFGKMWEICCIATVMYVAQNVTELTYTVILDCFTFLVIMAQKSSPVTFFSVLLAFLPK
jgi:hypothetical protein